MAISVVGQASAAATSVAIPAHQVGDLIIVTARGTAAAPVAPAAGGTVPTWTAVQSGLANSIGLTTVAAKATATNHTTGTFTSATHIAVLVLRPGAGNQIQLGTSATGNANNQTTIGWPALTLGKADGTSCGVRIGTRVTAASQLATPPTSWTAQSVQPAGTPALVVHTRLALPGNPVLDTTTAGGANAAWRAHTVEVQELAPVTYFGAASLALTYAGIAAGTRKTFSTAALPVTFAAAVAGDVTTPSAPTYYGVVAASWSFGAATQAQRKTFGVVAASWSFGEVTQGTRKTFGVVARPITFAAVVAGTRRTFGTVAAPFTFGAVTQGRRKTFGVVARPITFGAVTQGTSLTGPQTRYGVVAAPFTFGAVTQGRRKTFGVVARPITFAAATQARRKTFAQVYVPVTFAAVTQARRKTFSTSSLPLVLTVVTAGQVRAGTVLNDADNVYLGNRQVDAVYAGSVKVWQAHA